MRHLTIIVFSLLLGTGCPPTTDASGPVDVCTSAGTQCRMGGGKLGVCTTDAKGAMRCASQH